MVAAIKRPGWIRGILGALGFAAIGFGLVISLTSCYFGISVRGGAVGVGRAVNASADSPVRSSTPAA